MTGWLSPQGVLYPCRARDRDSRAQELTHLADYLEAGSELLLSGWAWVTGDGLDCDAEWLDTLTDEQVAAIDAERARERKVVR
jgi:hypothetical protein